MQQCYGVAKIKKNFLQMEREKFSLLLIFDEKNAYLSSIVQISIDEAHNRFTKVRLFF